MLKNVFDPRGRKQREINEPTQLFNFKIRKSQYEKLRQWSLEEEKTMGFILDDIIEHYAIRLKEVKVK